MKSYKIYLAAFFIIAFSHHMIAQNLSEHQWENRILVILVDDYGELYKKQVEFFQVHEAGLLDRKFVIYALTPIESKKGLKFKEIDMDSSIYRNLKKTEYPFELVLIGLDGGVKERFSEPQSGESVFKIVDRMPMRRAEMKKKGRRP